MSSSAALLRFAIVRSLSKTQGFSIAAIIILALGIGENTAVFSILAPGGQSAASTRFSDPT